MRRQIFWQSATTKGLYIRAWGRWGIGCPDVKIIIDTMLNLPLLCWTGDERRLKLQQITRETAADLLIRPVTPLSHIPDESGDGEAVSSKDTRDMRDESVWARKAGVGCCLQLPFPAVMRKRSVFDDTRGQPGSYRSSSRGFGSVLGFYLYR